MKMWPCSFLISIVIPKIRMLCLMPQHGHGTGFKLCAGEINLLEKYTFEY